MIIHFKPCRLIMSFTSFTNLNGQHNLTAQMGDLYATQEVSPSLYMQYDENNWHYNGGGQTFLSQSSQAVPNIVKGSGAIEEFEDPVAQVLRAERRRGKEDKRPPPSVIEVRQADLTGGPKLREDRLRTTGIAFGPSYQVFILLQVWQATCIEVLIENVNRCIP